MSGTYRGEMYSGVGQEPGSGLSRPHFSLPYRYGIILNLVEVPGFR